MGIHFSKTRTTTLTSTVPTSITREALLSALHDQKFMIHLSPIVTSSELLPSWSPEIPALSPLAHGTWYKVQEQVPVIGTISFLAGFENTDEGAIIVVYAPAGMVMSNIWRIAQRTGEWDADEQGFELVEDCTVEANAMLIPFIMGNYESVHRKMHKRLLETVDSNAAAAAAKTTEGA